MIHSQLNRDILNKYPEVKKLVSVARKEKRFPAYYFPEILEAYDQLGLICGLAYGNYYCIDRENDHKFEFIAWFFDEQLTVFYMSRELVVNRLPIRD